MTNVTLAVDLKINGRTVPAGTQVDLDRVHAGNLIHRGLAQHTGRTPETPDPAPASEEPATAGDAPTTAADAKRNKGKE